ncbi:MAG: hypothetical protein WC901_04990 [Candidatus Margulisiibacteriota bacterium]
MKVSASIELTDDEKKQLAGTLHCNEHDLENILQPFAAAALREYTQMILGQRVFTRGSDIREFRLFLLICTAFEDKIPDEQSVCDLFQCTLTQGRALIRAVMSKYQYMLNTAISSTLVETLKRATLETEGDGVIVTINNNNIVVSLDRILASLDGTLPQVQKKKGTVATYCLKISSYLTLCKHLAIDQSLVVHE